MGWALARGLLLAALWAVSWPVSPARAHASLVEATPAPGAVLATPPPRLQVLFSDELDADKSQLRVYGPGGGRADRRDQQVDGTRMWVSVIDQGPGVYQVRWKSVADEDQDILQGAYSFTITPQPPPQAPQITVTPAIANNGQPVAVAGSGFLPGGTVAIAVGDDEALLAVATADASGRFSVRAVLPADLPFGRQVVQAVDAADHLATAAIRVPTGGGPVAAVRLNAEFEEDTLSYTLRLENRSGYHLRGVVLRALIPEGTRVLAEDLGQPDGFEASEVGGGQVVWRGGRLPPHTMAGPFTFSVETAAPPNSAIVASIASVEFIHSASPPEFRGVARSPEVAVQVAR